MKDGEKKRVSWELQIDSKGGIVVRELLIDGLAESDQEEQLGMREAKGSITGSKFWRGQQSYREPGPLV